MNVKLNYNQIMVDASNRLHAIINACINKDNDSIICNACSSLYSCEKDIPTVVEEKEHPVLDQDLCFNYRGYEFGFTSCNCITTKEQMLGLTNENFNERFPLGAFTDRYVCWMFGHKDYDGYTEEESDEPEHWTPQVYLVPEAWNWGAGWDLKPGNEVYQNIIDAIDKFLETFKE